jgi:phosphatidylinositol phospholipase C, epsilon
MMYRRFNPWDKEFDGFHSVHLVLTVVSGQYVNQTNFTSSVYVEVEVIGLPRDCAKQKTKIIYRNAINPIWNDALFFQIIFRYETKLVSKIVCS